VAIHNPVTYDRRQFRRLSARLLLAHLEDDPDMRGFYRDLVRHESGLPEEAFILADSTAELFARGYPNATTRENVRKELTTFLEEH
jgi:hypothetical protein